MFVRLQLVTILHNYIDNRNHYLYHFRPLRMKPLPVSAACTDWTPGDQPHRREKQREHAADRATGRQRV